MALVTAEQKDRVLKYLVDNIPLGESGQINVREHCKMVGLDSKAFIEFLDFFESEGLIEQLKFLGGGVSVTVKMASHTFLNRGGFEGEETLLLTSIEKLKLELEALSKELPEKEGTFTKMIAMVANIASILSLGKG